MKIGVGTAQFGLDYGISNAAGRVGQAAACAILEQAARQGVAVLDTAAVYGEAEAAIGSCLGSAAKFHIVTKLPHLPSHLDQKSIKAWVFATLEASLRRLRQDRVAALLMHSAGDLLGPLGPSVHDALCDLRREGLVESIGASVYHGAEIDALLDCCALDVVQLPINVLDQRLLSGGQLRRLREHGVQIHARSLFLQGLLLMPTQTLPHAHFDAVRPVLARFHRAAEDRSLTPLQAAVAFARSISEIDVAIFGVTTPAELQDIMAAAQTALPLAWFEPFAIDDESILNPVKWPLK